MNRLSQLLKRIAPRRRKGRLPGAVRHTLDVSVPPTALYGVSTGAWTSYAAAVQALTDKYMNKAEWGCQILGNVVNLLAAFTIGQGVTLIEKKPSRNGEWAFVQNLIERNRINTDVAQDWAVEALLEGKCLIRLAPHATTRSIDARHVPWTQHAYHIQSDATDYSRYLAATFRLNQTGKTIRVADSHFVFKPFGGRIHNVNETPPRIASVLKNIEWLDKALQDWREINHLFAAPTPVIRCETAQQARDAQRFVEEENWRIGHFLSLSGGEFSLVGLSPSAGTSLEREITTNAKLISGATGVPVHLLGFPDLLSNRSTAQNLFELLQASTSKDRRIWVSMYEELFAKSMRLSNRLFGTQFDPSVVGVAIAEISSLKLRELSEIWLPLYSSGVISLETILAKIPGVDIAGESERLHRGKENKGCV